MHKIARRSKTPIATGERLIASYGCRELIEMGVVDILQTDINHVGGITALWKGWCARQLLKHFHGTPCV
jgi:galactonate dehydratase